MLEGGSLLHPPSNISASDGVADLLTGLRVAVAAVDAPCGPACPGESSREGERELRKKVCGIRYTPDLDAMRSHPRDFYGWILNGLDLYAALDGAGITCVECFPTATFTRVAGPRRTRSRARWTTEALEELGLSGLIGRSNQDERDALAAGLTAQAYLADEVETFCDIVVPREGWRPNAD